MQIENEESKKDDLTKLLELSFTLKASDLHLSPGQHPIFRIDGDLIEFKELPLVNSSTMHRFLYSIIEKKQQDEFESLLEIDFSYALKKGGFRVNAFHQQNGVSCVFR